MFRWFGAAILITGIVVASVMNILGAESGWHQEIARFESFTRHNFESSWQDPARRDDFARSLHERLAVDVTLLDNQGQELGRFGAGSCCAPMRILLGPQADLGEVQICSDKFRHVNASRILLAVLICCVMLWVASGAIAYKLSKPVADLARVAGDLGAGKLTSRLDTRSGEFKGEEHVLADVINDMADRIERQLADQRALLATVSHEIRTPLARMRLLVEMARDRSTDQVTLDKLDREVIEIDALVSDLLASSRIDFSTLNATSLDAREISTAALERTHVDPTALLFEASEPTFPGDPTLVARAIHNLLENARHHAGGVSQLRVFDRGDHIAFEVEDEGPGLAPGDEMKIFRPFYRGERPSNSGSVGLGLSLVRRIAEAHGGVAYARNREGGVGACVGVTFAR
jgi:signal transduction histidine kinase